MQLDPDAGDVRCITVLQGILHCTAFGIQHNTPSLGLGPYHLNLSFALWGGT